MDEGEVGCNWRPIPGGYIIKDANGQSLASVYADNRQIVNMLTDDEARRIASNITIEADIGNTTLPRILDART